MIWSRYETVAGAINGLPTVSKFYDVGTLSAMIISKYYSPFKSFLIQVLVCCHAMPI